MNTKRNNLNQDDGPVLPGRRQLLKTGIGLAAASLLPLNIGRAQATTEQATPAQSTKPIGRRTLGSLEVSSLGIGAQNMTRTYQTTIPTRSEMINIIRTAFDQGVTFFDAAEAYGPFEVERLLGEGVAPFRDQVAITSKFGWDIDLETGQTIGGLNSRPDHCGGYAHSSENRSH